MATPGTLRGGIGDTIRIVRPFELVPRRTPRRRRRTGVSSQASELLGVPVRGIVPLQRHNPVLVLAASVAELLALVVFIAATSLAALALLLAVSLVLVVLSVTNRHQILAITSHGHVALAANNKGWPRTVVGPVPRQQALPEPAGVGQPVELAGTTWWVDRSAFRYLRHARELLQADGEDDSGEGEDDGRQDGDAVQVAFDHRRPGGRRAEAASEHLREAASPSAVEEDQHDQRQ
jgi:hypothetical protein